MQTEGFFAEEVYTNGLLGGAILAIWNDIPEAVEAEFQHWLTREHVPERVSGPGFFRGRRYVAVSGGPKYFTFYEMESLATMQGAAYIARLNEELTPWSRRMLAMYANPIRTASRRTFSYGVGVGGTLATLRLEPRDGAEDGLRAWLTATALPSLCRTPEVVGAHFCEAEPSLTRVPSEVDKLMPNQAIARWTVLVEGTDSERIEASWRRILGDGALIRHGAVSNGEFGVYRLVYCLAR